VKLRYQNFVNRIDIDALEQYIGFEPLRHHNGNDIGYCIWPENHSHGDTTGKFSIHRDKKVYGCWVCGGGSLLSLIMEYEKCDMDTATEILYRFTRNSEETQESIRERLKAQLHSQNEPPPKKTPLPYFNPRVLDQFDGPRDYFYGRGLSDEVIERYRLCYSDKAKRSDFEGPAAIFPHFWKGRLVGWQYRWTEWKKGFPVGKYTNTHSFPKDETIFNFDTAKDADEPVVVVESVPTALLLVTYGLPAVATFGDTVTETQMRILRGFQQGLVFVPDNDRAGITHYGKVSVGLDRYTSVRMTEPVGLKPKADLADYLETDSPYENILIHLSNQLTPQAFARKFANDNK
jgi:DNA primase